MLGECGGMVLGECGGKVLGECGGNVAIAFKGDSQREKNKGGKNNIAN